MSCSRPLAPCIFWALYGATILSLQHDCVTAKPRVRRARTVRVPDAKDSKNRQSAVRSTARLEFVNEKTSSLATILDSVDEVLPGVLKRLRARDPADPQYSMGEDASIPVVVALKTCTEVPVLAPHGKAGEEFLVSPLT